MTKDFGSKKHISTQFCFMKFFVDCRKIAKDHISEVNTPFRGGPDIFSGFQ